MKSLNYTCLSIYFHNRPLPGQLNRSPGLYVNHCPRVTVALSDHSHCMSSLLKEAQLCVSQQVNQANHDKPISLCHIFISQLPLNIGRPKRNSGQHFFPSLIKMKRACKDNSFSLHPHTSCIYCVVMWECDAWSCSSYIMTIRGSLTIAEILKQNWWANLGTGYFRYLVKWYGKCLFAEITINWYIKLTIFYFLYCEILTSRALLTLEELPLPGLANS